MHGQDILLRVSLVYIFDHALKDITIHANLYNASNFCRRLESVWELLQRTL